jgi:hypothetical protein
MPDSVLVANSSPFDSAIYSDDLASSTAFTVPILPAPNTFLLPPSSSLLHSSSPRWKDNVKALAQKRAISAIVNLKFDRALFEKLNFERVLDSTLPYGVDQTESALDSIFFTLLCDFSPT